MIKKIINLIVNTVEIKEEEKKNKLSRDSLLIEDLGMTSLQFIALVVGLEKTFNIEFKDSDLSHDNFKTISDIEEIVKNYVNNKHIIRRKCLILDCDDVLWKGVSGEEKILIDENVLKFQKLLIELYNKGVVLCLCSKNDVHNIRAAFSDQRMILTMEHIVDYQINRTDKATNIAKISAFLNISFDSIVFADNSEYELGFIRANIPDICAIKVDYNDMQFIENISKIFSGSYTALENRTLAYKEQKEREKAKSKYNSISEYNESLHTNIICRLANEQDIKRVVELSQRTNQFNLSSIRYSEEEIIDHLSNSNIRILVLCVSDIYGDMGLIGMSVTNIQEKTIEAFCLSCRAFDRGFEFVLLDETKNLVKGEIAGIYVDNGKNTRFSGFYLGNGVSII